MAIISKTFARYVLDILLRIAVKWLIFCVAFVYYLIFDPNTVLNDGYNPTIVHRLDDPVSFVSRAKLVLLQENPQICLAELSRANITFEKRKDFAKDENCGIKQRILLQDLKAVKIRPTETQCHIAFRLALWAEQVVRPAAKAYFNQPLEEIILSGSYNCRKVNAGRKYETRFSTHASANAIDVSGFRLENGREIWLTEHWDGFSVERGFLRAIRDGGCLLFNQTLSPDYNVQHEDHFHFDAGTTPGCL